ncbi:hypothetical protein QAD02_016193 [Eretmocerus hayati]|uniref:Uncharacterized protein n=1 Tax=Eretmocerus hayati TaxID=131215 RepID=A0ACC2PAB6_9HYME|nr:hypothetical protein QAD02_016193 [Eretmocerus hayati]
MANQLTNVKVHDPTGIPPTVEDNASVDPSVRDILPQIIASCIAHCTMLQGGFNLTYTAILEDGLRKSGVPTEEISWIASLATITIPVGAMASGPLMDRYGRKMLCLISCLPALLSWAILMTTRSAEGICLARMIGGFSVGLSTGSLVYVSEITHPWIRSVLLSFHSVFPGLGGLITNCLGAWLTWKEMTFVYFAVTLGVFFMLLFIPESPHWFMYFSDEGLQERESRVASVLKRLNRSERIYQQELARINELSRQLEATRERNDSIICEKINAFFKLFKIPSVYKPTIILLAVFIFQQLSGTNVVPSYALSIFDGLHDKFGKGTDKYKALIVLGFTRFLGGIGTALASKKIGRRTLCISSGLGMALSMLYLALCIHFKSSKDASDFTKMIFCIQQNWVPTMLIVFHTLASSFGWAMVPWTLIGELLPTSVRGFMGGFIMSYATILMFAMLKVYHSMIEKMDIQGVFCFYGVVSLLSCIFVYLFLPGTRGKSPNVIEIHFNEAHNGISGSDDEVPTKESDKTQTDSSV